MRQSFYFIIFKFIGSNKRRSQRTKICIIVLIIMFLIYHIDSLLFLYIDVRYEFLRKGLFAERVFFSIMSIFITNNYPYYSYYKYKSIFVFLLDLCEYLLKNNWPFSKSVLQIFFLNRLYHGETFFFSYFGLAFRVVFHRHGYIFFDDPFNVYKRYYKSRQVVVDYVTHYVCEKFSSPMNAVTVQVYLTPSFWDFFSFIAAIEPLWKRSIRETRRSNLINKAGRKLTLT